MEMATCKVCVTDYALEDMISDIEGAIYCLIDSGRICPVCGVFDHNCEGQDEGFYAWRNRQEEESLEVGRCDHCATTYDIGSRSDHCGDCGVCWKCHPEHQTSYCEGEGK
jgi:hypothetical protein